jgi:hypothetical protein
MHFCDLSYWLTLLLTNPFWRPVPFPKSKSEQTEETLILLNRPVERTSGILLYVSQVPCRIMITSLNTPSSSLSMCNFGVKLSGRIYYSVSLGKGKLLPNIKENK